MKRLDIQRPVYSRRIEPHELPSRGHCPVCGTFGRCTRSVDHGEFRQQYRKCPACGENYQTAIKFTDKCGHASKAME